MKFFKNKKDGKKLNNVFTWVMENKENNIVKDIQEVLHTVSLDY